MDDNGKWLCENNYFKISDLEPYIEEEHGWHHSDEYIYYGKDPDGNKVR